MTENPSAEPHLDEILASIRRIISEDGPAAAASPLAHGMRHAEAEGGEDVLVLTRRAPGETDAGPAKEDDEAPPAPALQSAPEPAPEPESVAGAGEDAQAQQDEHEEVVVAPQTQAKAAAAFDKLSAVAHEAEPTPTTTISAPGRTLEDVVRELMRPMLKEWLDENLASIVQTRVDQEIERITRLRGR